MVTDMIVKPIRLGVLRRVSSGARGHDLWITALGAFELDASGDFLTEAQLWQTAAPALGATALDAGMPKPGAEVLVAGDVRAAAGESVSVLQVVLELGSVRKRVAVFGPRWWRYGPDGPEMTRPGPIERVALDWRNAFGGPGCAENPGGKGADARERIGRREPAELPMIESPEALITDIAQRPEPAGLGPRPEDAPSRLRYAGVHDDAWLRDGFPGPGRGFDARYHHAACPDQQTDTAFTGDEPFRITSMHPEHPDLRGRLPGFRVRGFARRGDELLELSMRCDTVWLFPNALMGIVLFRGGLAVADKEASDIRHVMLAYERVEDERRTLAHYRTAFDERIDPELAVVKMLDERPLRPERLPEEVAAVEEERAALAEERKRRQEAAREFAIAGALGMAGLPAPPPGLFDQDLRLPVEIPVVTRGEIERMEADLAGLMTKMNALADHVAREGESQRAVVQREVARVLNDAAGTLDPRLRAMVGGRLAQASTGIDGGLDLPRLDAGPDAGAGALDPALDRLFDNAGRWLGGDAGAVAGASGAARTGMSTALRRARNRALGTADEDDPFVRARAMAAAERSSVRSRAAEMDGGKGETRAGSAAPEADIFAVASRHLQGPGASAGAADGSDPRAAPRAALASPIVGYFTEATRPLAGGAASSSSSDSDSPADADAALDEVERRLDEAGGAMQSLEADGRRLSPEPLAPIEPLSAEDAASLGELARELGRSDGGLKNRDLAGVALPGADLRGMDLGGVFLERANLANVVFAGANLARAVLTGADLTGADLCDADLTDSNLNGADLSRAKLCNARLDRVQLMRARLDGADLSGVSLTEVSPLETSMTGACLDHARMRDASFVKCDLSGISLDGARLNTVTVVESATTGLRAPRARFERCALIGVEAEEADLTEAVFVRSACIGGAKLARARMGGLVSEGSGWRGADLSGADLAGARLDASDLGGTKLAGACLRRASLRRAVLSKADATGADFHGATLLEAQAHDVDLTRASLHRANLYSADLTGAKLARCDLTGANLALTLMTKPADAA